MLKLRVSLASLVVLGWVAAVQAQDLRTLFGTHQPGFNVSLVLPGDPAFANDTRPFNLRFDFEPAAVAFPATAQEVSKVIKLGQLVNHQVVARSGGHSYIANALGGKDGAIVIDMRNFQAITVDDTAGTAVIEVGNRLGDIISALAAHGRGLPHGTCPYVGFGGHAAYGGFGFTSRLWGLTVDAILSIDVVLANGTITTVSEKNHPDLFFALRGSGASFGIATAYTMRTFPAPPTATIFSYNWQFTASGAAAFLASYQSFVLSTPLPPTFGAEIVITPGNVQGNVSIGLAGGWYAPLDQLNSTLGPFFATVPAPRAMSFDTGDYLHSAINLAGGSLDTKDQPDNTDTFYAKSLMTPQGAPMSGKALQAFMDVVANEGFTTDVGWFFQAELFGGRNSAINAVKTGATAFSRRDSLFTIQFYASSKGNVPPYPESGFTFLDHVVNSIVDNSPPNWDYGAYTNYIDDRLIDWQRRYYSTNYPRLRRLKDLYDPRGTFTFPTSIQV
ncbi:glucooligosaccharide oxidase [Pholiota conissans]|uniref:Glucooligosaccharide oxidase n=1 Tax=Pholiota conissans TaxID=109636 RepID=A0A9P5Z8D4_9AGAR|nr:glucooligosaccharide oxidase [Pholiota conissans]